MPTSPSDAIASSVPAADFYASLPALPAFDHLTNPAVFASVPADWWLVIADLAGSTQAIEAGRYKDVNLLGAACIAALKESTQGRDFPFVFGGDGASAAIAPQWRDAAAGALASVQALARDQFQLHLRIGFVSVQEVISLGQQTLVAKLQLQGQQSIALFRGGGLRQAEALVKADPERYCVEVKGEYTAQLANLSCRWQPLASQHGTVLSLLVSALGPDADLIYSKLLSEMTTLFGGHLENASPVSAAALHYSPLVRQLRDERRLQASPWSISYLRRIVTLFAGTLAFGVGLARWLPKLKRYQQTTGLHSDYRKFDDMLRMVLDCTSKQRQGLIGLLEQARARGEIAFGIHESSHCLMTCYLQSMDSGGHIHFIDGSDGGYAMAAKQLKLQLSSTGPRA